MAAAVITNAAGEVLLAQRPPGKPYRGYWEFPGGKIEPGEAPYAALVRELEEELGITVTQAWPWITRDYDYTHASVRLTFFRVTAWSGTLHGREGQAFSWQVPPRVAVSPLLPANAPILRALELPPVYAVTHAAALGAEVFLQRCAAALALEVNGVRLIQVREKTMAGAALADFTRAVVVLAHARGARVLVNAERGVAETASLIGDTGADGMHLTAAQLMSAPARPDVAWCGASCHTRAELERAASLGLDFAVLGHVQATPSHPDAAPLGWARFSELIKDLPLPVYAIGGLARGDRETAWRAGAHGLALLRAAWEEE